MLDYNVNYWAVVVAAIINMVVGALWYSPVLFSKAWMKFSGLKTMGSKNGAGFGYAITTVAALVQTFVLAVFTVSLNVTDPWVGACLGLTVWIGFAVTTSISDYVFAQRSKKLFVLNQGYYAVVLAINGAVLAMWR